MNGSKRATTTRCNMLMMVIVNVKWFKSSPQRELLLLNGRYLSWLTINIRTYFAGDGEIGRYRQVGAISHG